jgi:hypothetical protein
MRASGEVELVLLEALLPDVNRLCDLVFDPFAFAFFKVTGFIPEMKMKHNPRKCTLAFSFQTTQLGRFRILIFSFF